METLIGIVIGIVVTVAVSHYYFRRSINKHLSVYVVLSSRVFSGIDQTVRKHLSFLFHEKQVNELQQVELIIANDGERPISDCIKPLRLVLPTSIAILDASILHKSSEGMEITLERGSDSPSEYFLQFNFTLLNKGDYFLVKLLLDGAMPARDLNFTVTAEDLPRTIKPQILPFMATRKSKREIDWAGVSAGGIFIAFAIVVAHLGLFYFDGNKSAFPWPWRSFNFSWPATIILFLSIVVIGLTGLLGLLFLIGMGFESFYTKGTKFPLPDELHDRSLVLLTNTFDVDFNPYDINVENPPKVSKKTA